MYEDLVKLARHCAEVDACINCPVGGCQGVTGIMNRLADAVEELSRAQEQWIEQERKTMLKSLPRWIPVTERLPELNIHVLVLCEFRAGKAPKPQQYWQTVGRNTINRSKPENRYWALYGGESLFWEPTHWMPLPEPPKEDRADG